MQLNDIGFEWRTPKDNSWQKRFCLLCEFQHEHGHCRVPEYYAVNSVELGRWVMNQRRSYQNFQAGKKRNPGFRQEQIAQVNDLGFEWTAETEKNSWQQFFDLLCKFQGQHGHCHFPWNYVVDSVALGQWVINQRRDSN